MAEFKKHLQNFSLLKDLLMIKSPSGEEAVMKQFIMEYIKRRPEISSKWKVIEGAQIQDCLIMRRGNPRVAVFAHMDTIGFTSRYENQLVSIGSPDVNEGAWITGTDSFGPIECQVKLDSSGRLFHDFKRPIDRGTSLVFKPEYIETSGYICSPSLDNRIGLFILLLLAEAITDGILVFSSWEEHGGGSIPYLSRIIYEKFNINKALIADVTWVTDGVFPGKGAVISMRDKSIPRKIFIGEIILI